MTLGDDDVPRRPVDVRTKLVAIMLILALIAGVAPFLLNLVL